MDYDGIYQDLQVMRERAMSDSRWCEFGGRWKQLAEFVDDIDQFVNDILGIN